MLEDFSGHPNFLLDSARLPSHGYALFIGKLMRLSILLNCGHGELSNVVEVAVV